MHDVGTAVEGLGAALATLQTSTRSPGDAPLPEHSFTISPGCQGSAQTAIGRLTKEGAATMQVDLPAQLQAVTTSSQMNWRMAVSAGDQHDCQSHSGGSEVQ